MAGCGPAPPLVRLRLGYDRGDPPKVEFRDRAAFYRTSLATLWDERSGMFLNKDLRTGRLSSGISSTNFYVLLTMPPVQTKRTV
jgi:hypothetical protein